MEKCSYAYVPQLSRVAEVNGQIVGAKHTKIPVINAMTSENHPCEIIANLYALSKLHEEIEKKKFLFVGVKGNIGNTWKAASELMGFELEQCCPAGYEIDNINFHTNIDEAVIWKRYYMY